MPTISTLTVDVESNTSKFASGLKIAAGGLAVLAAGAAYAFGQFEESEKVANQTTAVLKSTGDAANTTAKHVTDLAGALSMKAGIDDEAIQSGENMILTFKNISNEAGKGNAIFDRTTKAVLDMSVAMGQDMKQSAIQVGKALNDPIAGMSALSRVGVTFSAQQKLQITQMQNHNNLLGAQKIILGELTSEFGGSAAAQATATGKMKVALGNLAETIGKVLAPAITFLINGFMKMVSWIQANVGPVFKDVQTWFQGVLERLQPVAKFLQTQAVAAWHALTQATRQLWPDIKRLWEAMQPGLKVLGVLAAAILYVAIRAIPPTIRVIGFLIDIIVKSITTFLKWANSIGSAITEVIGFFARLVTGAREKFGQVVDFIRDIPSKIKGFFSSAGSWLYNAGKDVLIGLWNGMKSMFTTIWNGLTGWVSGLVDHVKSFLHIGSPSKVFEEIGVNMMAGMDRGIRSGSTDVRGTLKGLTGAVGGVGGDGVGGNVTINVQGYVGNEAQLAQKIQEALLKLKARNGTTGL